MLNIPSIDVSVLTSVGANIGHLLFVKYEKDPIMAKEILYKCYHLKVDLNHIRTMTTMLADLQKMADLRESALKS